jgi:hypothetical protein
MTFTDKTMVFFIQKRSGYYMKIERFIVGIMQVNGYVVYDENT